MDPTAELQVRALPLTRSVGGVAWRRPAHLLDAEIDGELLVLDPASGRLHVLSHSAGVIYAAADGMSTTADVVASLGTDSGLTVDRMAEDVTAAVAAMLDQGLLVADDPSSDTAGRPVPRVGGVLDPDARTARVATTRLTDFGPRCAGAAVVRVTSSAPAVDALLSECLALLPRARSSETAECVVSVTDPGDGGPFEIRDDSGVIASAVSEHDAAEAVLAACNRIATTAPVDAVRIHGGAAAAGDRAVVVCGESGAGKSSLTAALARSGWRYLTDEVAVVDAATRTVTPYPKWIDLSAASLQLLGLGDASAIGPAGPKHHVPPTELGQVGAGATVEAIVLLVDPGDESDSAPRELEPGDAVLAVLANVFATTWEHPHGLQAVADLCTTTTVVQMPRRPLDEMVALVGNLVG